MTNHVHLVVYAPTALGLQKAMHGLNLSYTLAYKRRYPHIGHFWQDRFKSLLIAQDNYLLQCGAYVELNPVRARMVASPEAYPWSSYRVYAQGARDPLITLNPLYDQLGTTPEQRQAHYRQFVLSQSSAALQTHTEPGLAIHLGRSSMSRPRGRPRRSLVLAEVAK